MKKIFILLIIGLMLAGITSVTVAATCNANNDGSNALNGCYLGVYPGCGSEDISCETITEFNTKMEKQHAIFIRYIDIKDSRNPKHWNWSEEVIKNRAMPMFIYEPYDGLGEIDMDDVEYFAIKCREIDETVFIVFGHEMNGPWFPWGNDPLNYTNKFKEIAEIFHQEAPKVEMCWVPNQNWGYPWYGNDHGDGYSEYYPEGIGTYGEYVDWVGLNFYERDYDQDNLIPTDMFTANIINEGDNTNFYEMFAVGKNKPMLIAETGAFDPNKDPTSVGERIPLNKTEQATFKNNWIRQVYNVSLLQNEYPRLNIICYFHVNKSENIDTQNHNFYDIILDYRIPDDPNVYKELISDPYFIGAGQGLCGDVNNDELINADDVQGLLSYFFTGDINIWAGDVDGNDHINILDARLLMNHIADQQGYQLNCK